MSLMLQEIKKAYKRLVKERHPDRSDAPDANDRSVFFLYADKGYLLSNPDHELNYHEYRPPGPVGFNKINVRTDSCLRWETMAGLGSVQAYMR